MSETVPQSSGPWAYRKSNRIRPLMAWRAMQKLLKDPEETGEVFKIIEALKGGSLTKGLARFLATEEGRERFAERRQILEKLEDRDYLRTLPENSLGHTYLRFVEMENLSAAGLTDASMEAPRQGVRNEDEAWYGERLRDTHDLYHVVTGYGRDALGELTLLEFTETQNTNRGIRFIITMASRRIRKEGNWNYVEPVLTEAKARAISAAWLATADWENLLPLPLAEVREKLRLTDPDIYKRTREQYPDENHPPTDYEVAA